MATIPVYRGRQSAERCAGGGPHLEASKQKRWSRSEKFSHVTTGLGVGVGSAIGEMIRRFKLVSIALPCLVVGSRAYHLRPGLREESLCSRLGFENVPGNRRSRLSSFHHPANLRSR